MPFLTFHVWPGLSQQEKQQIIFKATEITTTLLGVPPDKIQILIYDISRENWGKAGSVPLESNFSIDSRIINWETKEAYFQKQEPVNNMMVVTIDVWDSYDQEQKDQWIKLLTDFLVIELNVPADKVLVLIRDMPPGNWGQTGVTGANEEFLNKSRRVLYKNKKE